MRFSAQALFALILATFCSAQIQSLGELPDCAKPCAANLPANCKLDVKCICADADFIKSISCCVADACSAQDLQKTLQVAQQFCSTVKVTLQAPGPDACPKSGGSGGASSAASDATSSAAAQVSSEASSAISSQAASASSQASSAAAGVSSMMSSASAVAGSATQASSSATSSAAASTGGAVQYASNKIGGLGAAVAAVLLL
ncbi:uncharacterized protein KY384_009142 [Bacidia gigantensis]|uniref:uncharacterized protein n=1 Tax=Bacidia gigantensis TaxID=2732470 RepID=UPI001D04A340|nr:uncharacterized protein KY384_009142 [Bacidia gigantensis]KAG8525498.1 hypothetical protein KY384_009142 [Bacidia gigantensis]